MLVNELVKVHQNSILVRVWLTHSENVVINNDSVTYFENVRAILTTYKKRILLNKTPKDFSFKLDHLEPF